MFTAHPPGKYGCGWFVESSPRGKIHHEGGDPGFAAFEARYPDQHVIIIVLANADDSPVREIAQMRWQSNCFWRLKQSTPELIPLQQCGLRATMAPLGETEAGPAADITTLRDNLVGSSDDEPQGGIVR
jgi:hypothetical protein